VALATGPNDEEEEEEEEHITSVKMYLFIITYSSHQNSQVL